MLLRLLEVLANSQAYRVECRAMVSISFVEKRAGPVFEISGVGVLAAFLGGALSFLSPCVLPLAPGYVSYIAGQPGQSAHGVVQMKTRLNRLLVSLYFVMGFSTVFISLGAGASLLGGLLLQWKYELGIVGGALIIVFGLVMTGLIRPGILLRDTRFTFDAKGGNPLGAYLLGLAFAFGWTPCIGPVLGSILTVSAASGADGVALLTVYSVGLGVPFLLLAAFTNELAARIRRLGRASLWLHRVAGVVMIAMGIAVMTGQITDIAFWLLETFPVLGTIG